MALPYTPHLATVQSVSQAKGADRRNDAIKWTDSLSLRGMLTSQTTATAYEQWGVELKRPHKWLFNLADADSIKSGDRLSIDGRTFNVTTAVKRSAHGLITDHASVLLEELP